MRSHRPTVYVGQWVGTHQGSIKDLPKTLGKSQKGAENKSPLHHACLSEVGASEETHFNFAVYILEGNFRQICMISRVISNVKEMK